MTTLRFEIIIDKKLVLKVDFGRFVKFSKSSKDNGKCANKIIMPKKILPHAMSKEILDIGAYQFNVKHFGKDADAERIENSWENLEKSVPLGSIVSWMTGSEILKYYIPKYDVQTGMYRYTFYFQPAAYSIAELVYLYEKCQDHDVKNVEEKIRDLNKYCNTEIAKMVGGDYISLLKISKDILHEMMSLKTELRIALLLSMKNKNIFFVRVGDSPSADLSVSGILVEGKRLFEEIVERDSDVLSIEGGVIKSIGHKLPINDQLLFSRLKSDPKIIKYSDDTFTRKKANVCIIDLSSVDLGFLLSAYHNLYHSRLNFYKAWEKARKLVSLKESPVICFSHMNIYKPNAPAVLFTYNKDTCSLCLRKY